MDIRSVILSRKYAEAFLNLFFDSITPETISNLTKLQHYLKNHKNATILFSLHHIPLDAKLKLLDDLGLQLHSCEHIKKLFEILIRHDRAELVLQVFTKICQLYRERKNILMFDIQGSHELDEQSIASIEKFLARSTGKNIQSKQHINKDLIAGLRLQSDTFLWEYSISKQIKKLTQTIAAKE